MLNKDLILNSENGFMLIKNIRGNHTYYTIVNRNFPKIKGKSVHRHFNDPHLAHALYKRLTNKTHPKRSSKSMMVDYIYLKKGGHQ